jgi:hypothetical protein
MTLDISTRVIIRVWTSQDNKQFPGNNVGHISIETPNNYMSLWPIPHPPKQKKEFQEYNILKQKYLKYFMERPSDFLQSYQDDYHAEGGIPPQVTICLYSLDHYMVDNEFYKLKMNTGWRLVGSNLLVQKLDDTVEAMVSYSKIIETKVEHKNIDNCASLALKMLKAGRITQLVDTSTYSSTSVCLISVCATGPSRSTLSTLDLGTSLRRRTPSASPSAAHVSHSRSQARLNAFSYGSTPCSIFFARTHRLQVRFAKNSTATS